MAVDPEPERVARALAYHERTEHHHPSRFARSLGYLDWQTQPDPFLLHVGARSVLLDEVPVGEGHERSWQDVLGCGACGTRAGVPAERDASPAPAPVDRRSVSQLFFDSLALSAWKESGPARWPLRVNPSSGNLHPTEGYLLAGPIAGLTTGPRLFHYAPREHALEIRRRIVPEAWARLATQLPEGAIVVGLTSIAWREAWKYGERAFRYCQHDVGHAIGAVAVAAATLGWSARMIEGLSARALGRMLAVDDDRGAEVERPDVLLAICPRPDVASGTVVVALDDTALLALSATRGEGAPTPLSPEHHAWPEIDDVAEATEESGVMGDDSGAPRPARETAGPARETADGSWSPVTSASSSSSPGDAPPALPRRSASTRAMVRRRRSAVAMDGATRLDRDTFLCMAQRLLPVGAPGALGALAWSPRVHPVFFVHRVDGIDPGLLLLVRDPTREPVLRAALDLPDPSDSHGAVAGAPDGVRFVRLGDGDVRAVARACMCGQDIAADGAFAVAMMAELDSTLVERGASWWRRLHWEAGLLGQLLYLEAEAAGVSATGIGCFFDDAVSEVVGVRGTALRCLYGFTVGGAVDDPRIQTAPAYAGLALARLALDLEPPPM